MNGPFEPEETANGAGREPEDVFGDNSMTWGAAEPEFDRMLWERIGQAPDMPTPPYAFERVLVAGRRRRARKVWMAGATAALVVMAGTAGTTVALHGSSSGGGMPAASGAQSPTVSASASPSATPSPSQSASTASAVASTATPTQTGTSASPSPTVVPQCHSDTLQVRVSLVSAGSASTTQTLQIVLTNNSPADCTTHGYPGLETETQGGQLQNTTVLRNKIAVHDLTLAPGGSVYTLATFTTTSATGATATATANAGCGMPSYSLAVIPPNEQTQIVATIEGGPITVCGNGVLNTDPFAAGSGT
jgi:hypothetical protein